MKLTGKKNWMIILMIVFILLLIIVVTVIGVNNGKKSNEYKDNYTDNGEYYYGDYGEFNDEEEGNESNQVNENYVKMAKDIWKKEVILLKALNEGDIQILIDNAREDEYMIEDLAKNTDQEFIDAASQYIKTMYADLTWNEPDEERYESWALQLERDINEKLQGDGLMDDWIRLNTEDLVQGKNFVSLSSEYRKLYPNATGEWNNETTVEAYQKLSKTLEAIPTESLYLDIDVLEFDKNGKFVLAYDSVLSDTEIESLHTSYWLKHRYGDDSWVGHFIMEQVLD